MTITPILARIGHDVSRRIELGQHDEPDDVPEDQPRTIVIGFGRVGQLVADMLKTHDQPYLCVDSDIDCVAAGRREGYPIMFGDVARPEMVDRLKLGHARALIITMDEPVLAAAVVKRVRGWVPDLPIIVRARDADHAAELYRAGATDAVPETLESSLQLSEAVLVDLGVPMGPVIASIHDKRDQYRRQIMESGGLSKKPSLKTQTLRTKAPAAPSEA